MWHAATIIKWLYFKPEERSKQGSFYRCLAANITKYAPFFVFKPHLVGDRVYTCNAAKVLPRRQTCKAEVWKAFKARELLGPALEMCRELREKGARSVKYYSTSYHDMNGL